MHGADILPVVIDLKTLRDQPDAPAGAETIYRYDREGLLAALAAAAADTAARAPAGEAA